MPSGWDSYVVYVVIIGIAIVSRQSVIVLPSGGGALYCIYLGFVILFEAPYREG